MILPRSLDVSNLRLSNDAASFDSGRFREKICTLFEPSCDPDHVVDLGLEPGSVILSFTIRFVRGGPTVRHMRAQLVDPDLVQSALAPEFMLALPYAVHLFEDVQHRSNDALVEHLTSIKTIGAVNIVFVLVGLYGLVIFWSITSRGRACRKRAHSAFLADFVPSAESIQVFVLSAFLQLILSLSLHLVHTGTMDIVVLWGVIIALVGTAFNFVLNAWIRGESMSLREALSVDQIDKEAPGWNDESLVPGETMQQQHAALVEYSQVYTAGSAGEMQLLGHLAAHDWERFHLDIEKQMGLGMFDLSEQVFDKIKPDKDPSLLAAFLNSTIHGLVGRARQPAQPSHPAFPNEYISVPVDVPAGLRKSTVRDAMLQWKLRHTAHPLEGEAIDYLLGQLEPAGFGLVAVKVPENLRLLLVEALVQHAQQHADLQLDAAHAARLSTTLQQLSTRFGSMEVRLPDDNQHTDKVRELVVDALKARIERKSTRDITQEEGLLLQKCIQAFGPDYTLVAMDYTPERAEDQAHTLNDEIDRRADAVRSEFDEFLYDDEVFTTVPVIRRSKPPDLVELISSSRGPKRGRRIPAAQPRQTASPDARPPSRANSRHAATHESVATRGENGVVGPGPSTSVPSVKQPSPQVHARVEDQVKDALTPLPSHPNRAITGAPEFPTPDTGRSVSPPPAPTARHHDEAHSLASSQPSPPPSPPSPHSSPSLLASPVLQPTWSSEPVANQPAASPTTGLRQDQHSINPSWTVSFPPPNFESDADATLPNSSSGVADERRRLRQKTLSRRAQSRWRLQRRHDRRDHGKMPCWKQYSVLFVGSCLVVVSTISVSVLFTIIAPLTQYFVIFSFSGALPLSLVLHHTLRTALRYVRRHMALARGRRVEGTIRQRRARTRILLQPRARPKLVDQGYGQEEGSVSGDLTQDISSDLDAAWHDAVRRQSSAHISSTTLDQVPSLAERHADRMMASAVGDATTMHGRSCAGVLTRSAISSTATSGRPAVSTFCVSDSTSKSSGSSHHTFNFNPAFERRAHSRGAAEERGGRILAASGVVSTRGETKASPIRL